MAIAAKSLFAVIAATALLGFGLSTTTPTPTTTRTPRPAMLDNPATLHPFPVAPGTCTLCHGSGSAHQPVDNFVFPSVSKVRFNAL